MAYMYSVAILTKDNEETLEKTLESVKEFPEVIVVDTGSKDKTIEIASSYPNVKIFQHEFTGFGLLRNIAAEFASNNWIIALDSDEILPENVVDQLAAYELDPQVIYGFPRKNSFQGKWVKGCGWHPDVVYRIYNKSIHEWNPAEKVHETLAQPGRKLSLLSFYVEHTPYRTYSEFLHKLQLYTTLWAEQRKNQLPPSMLQVICHSLWAFIKSYFFQRGFLLGSCGWNISMYNAHSCYYKYLKLQEIAERPHGRKKTTRYRRARNTQK